MEDGYELISSLPRASLRRSCTNYAGAEDDYAQFVAGEDWTLLVQEGRVTAFDYERGRIVYGHEYALPAVSSPRNMITFTPTTGNASALASGRA